MKRAACDSGGNYFLAGNFNFTSPTLGGSTSITSLTLFLTKAKNGNFTKMRGAVASHVQRNLTCRSVARVKDGALCLANDHWQVILKKQS